MNWAASRTYAGVIGMVLMLCSCGGRGAAVPPTAAMPAPNSARLRSHVVQSGNSSFTVINGLAVGLQPNPGYHALAMVRSDDGLLFVNSATEYARGLVTVSDGGSVSSLVGDQSSGICSTTMAPLQAVSGGYVWAATNPDDGYLCRYDNSPGHAWKALNTGIPAATPEHMTLFGGYLWFSYFGDFSTGFVSGIVRMGIDGSNPAVFPLAQYAHVTGLAPGPNGYLWFSAFVDNPGTATQNAWFGEVNTSGQVVATFHVPFTPFSLVNVHGTMFYAYTPDATSDNINGSGIGTVAPGGSTTNYPLPANETPCTCTEMRSIVEGPFDNLWFQSPGGVQDFSWTERVYGAQIAVPALSSSNGYPWVMTFGTDGNLWVAGPNTSDTNLAIAVYLVNQMTVSPTNVMLSSSSRVASISVRERYFGGTFHASSTNAAVATVSPASQSGAKQPVTFTITRVGSGSATVWISDSTDQANNNRVPVTVTSQ